MSYKALKSFSGLVSMKKGEVKEINNNDVIKDLLHAGYIEEVGAKPTKNDTIEKPKTTAKKGKAKKEIVDNV